MPFLRSAITVGVFSLLVMFAAVGFFGGYQYTNNIQMNGTLAASYNSILGNASIFGGPGYYALQTQTNITGTQLQNSTAFSTLTLAVGSLGLAAKFIITIPQMFFTLSNFIAQPLGALGINAGFATAAVSLLILVGIILTVLSALFIYPL